jgi:hypothetical protein
MKNKLEQFIKHHLQCKSNCCLHPHKKNFAWNLKSTRRTTCNFSFTFFHRIIFQLQNSFLPTYFLSKKISK